ncbi:MAG: DUF2723 domain-containing protein [Bacteroidaceae bacterium]|nr:DUF2723 domain-containing protein [Bacteroidaceae bacterium]
MKKYNFINNLLGWITFAIAAFVYCSTIEPTASFWDCPEFITTAYKLEVGHPPGAPFFMLTANLFSQFVSDPSNVARMVNTMSALLSAACILFLFWTITHLARKLLCKDGKEPTQAQLITIMGSGLVGALAYTFSDTFWFSAVEGEVYAYSSLFTAAVFWLILKWEDQADEPHSDRWLILIAYLTGLSIGVHLLNLLCIPAIVLVFYYKRNPQADLKGSIIALIISAILVAAVLYGIVPGIVKMGGWFELLFVNQLGFSFNTGLYIYIALLVGIVIWAIYESYTEKNRMRMNLSYLLSIALLGIPFYGYGFSCVVIGAVILAAIGFLLWQKADSKLHITSRMMNTSLICLLMIMIGYSSYAVIVIRSSANTPMDQNSPEDIFTLGEYLGREQYGTRPLFYGPAYTSKVEFVPQDGYCTPKQSEGAPVYQRKEKASENEKDTYELIRHKTDYVYAQNMLFPRMWSADHASSYESILGGIDGTEVPYDQCGDMIFVKMPSQLDNIKFFFQYQLNFMYWRYFMWNFAGRQNDIQGYGETEHGNWISGFSWLDNAMLGDQDLLPDVLKENKGHNVFYCLPLLLGLIGLFWQAYKGERGIQQFWVTFFLFFMTGIAIVLYLNQTPMQPRERDYAYAGSFYAFTIWIGLGVAGIISFLEKKLNPTLSAAVVSVICLFVPIQMASQTWDDHDRSGRYTCRDFGQNYLMTLPEEGNPIIFTNGDNDTFPLWYNQDVEGFRTDSRVCNLSYLQTDWYIDQMRRPCYTSPSLPIHWDRIEYVTGTNEYVQVRPEMEQEIRKLYAEHPKEAKEHFGENPFEVKNILKHWVRNTDEDLHCIPTDTLEITLDKEAIRRSGVMIPGDSIPDKMIIPLQKRGLYKSELMMLEMLANANWERPIFMAITVGGENHLGLDKYFLQEGLAYRLTPFNFEEYGLISDATREHAVDSEKMYTNLMTKFKFGGIKEKGIYLDETVLRMCGSHRRMFSILVTQLLKEGKKDKALKALEYCEQEIPAYNIPHAHAVGSVDLAKAWLILGKKKEGCAILEEVANNAAQYCRYFLSLDSVHLAGSDFQYYLSVLNECANSLKYGDNELAETYAKLTDSLYNAFQVRFGKQIVPEEDYMEIEEVEESDSAE